MVQSPPQTLSLVEFLKQPETKPASEYIDGQVTQKPMPKGEHSAIQTELSAAINIALKHQRIARAFTELRSTFDGRAIIPDISVFQWPNIPRQENGRIADTFLTAPDWVVEILSPDQSQTKIIKKLIHCLNHGTRMGWLIDPKEQSVFTYHPDTSTTSHDEADEILPVPEFAKDFELTVAELFGWLLD